MSLATNITRRSGSKNYYARTAVPFDLQAKLGKRELWKSLQTADTKEAKRRARAVLQAWEQEFDRVRGQATPAPAPALPIIGYQSNPDTGESEHISEPAKADMIGWTEAQPAYAPDPRFQAVPAGETIKELYQQFQSENPGAVTEATAKSNGQVIALFDQFVGGTDRKSAHVSAINKANVRGWKAKLFQWPVKAAESKCFRGLSFEAVIERNKTEGKPAISHATINKYLSALGAFCTWLVSNGYLEADPTEGMHLTLDKKRKPRLPFKTAQLQALFASTIYTAPAATWDHKQWLPLIGAYSGARLGEIAQLGTADLKQIHGTWCFHVTTLIEDDDEDEDADEKHVKTAGSERVIPVHSELIRLGLIEYRAAMIAAGHKRLFPGIEPDARGSWSNKPSKAFGRYLDKIGLTDRRLNFHSFRHGAADAFRRGGYLDEQFGCLLGHTKASTTGRYGIMPEGVLADRVKMIEAISYPGLDLSRLWTAEAVVAEILQAA